MCFYRQSEYYKIKEIGSNEIKYIFKNLPQISHVNLIGGEPFIRKDIFEILDFLDGQGISIGLSTNGTFINSNNISKFKIKPYRCDISIDGQRELHNSIRGWQEAFDKTTEAVRLLTKIGVRVWIVSVIIKENLGELKRIIPLAYDLGAEKIVFEFARKYSHAQILESAKIIGIPEEYFTLRFSDEYQFGISIDRLREVLAELSGTGKKIGIPVGFFPDDLQENLEQYYYGTMRKNGTYYCTLLTNGLIDWNGNVTACYAINKSFGNLLESPMEKIWNGSEFRKFRKTLLKNNLLPICDSCLYKYNVNFLLH